MSDLDLLSRSLEVINLILVSGRYLGEIMKLGFSKFSRQVTYHKTQVKFAYE